jgi:hypothetical protein
MVLYGNRRRVGRQFHRRQRRFGRDLLVVNSAVLAPLVDCWLYHA